ncbi:hypothetical protein AB836_01720 [Rickettsiales bacterium (ex Bugula neritina AB1)]|nr:hypothetical protein AB836_01720 [Rickettsiales bacterium (ex Bugula neritina AB1)]
MKLTLNWLKSHFVNDFLSASNIVKYLEHLGIEVESIKQIGGKGFVVAKILTITPHKNSDRLNICEVEYEIDKIIKKKEVICGSPNIKENMYTILALEETILPSGIKIIKRNIRGFISSGMLCSWGEFGLTHIDKNEIILEKNCNLLEYLIKEDYIIDLSITANRNHLHYISGIAKEISYLSGENLNNTQTNSNHSFNSNINVSIDKQAVDSFGIIEINNFSINENYYEILSYLQKIIIPNTIPLINICNFITYDVGIPLQIYDKNKISNNLYVTFAKNGDVMKDFKGNSYVLNKKDIIVKDDINILCLGGIVSGDIAKCEKNTSSVIIEIALFNKKYLINTANNLEVFTDSYQRFLRDIYPINYHIALQKLLIFLKGNFSNVKYFGNNNLLEEKQIFLSYEVFYKTTGISMSLKKMNNYLIDNGYESEIINKNFNDKNLNNEMGLKITTHKHHINYDKDIVEEILRISQVTIEKNLFSFVKDKDSNEYLSNIHNIKNIFVMNNFLELMNYSFDTLGELELKNPIFKEKKFFKNSLINNVEENIKNILQNRFDIYKIFEVAYVIKDNKEIMNLCFCVRKNHSHWYYKNTPILIDIYNILNILKEKLQINITIKDNYICNSDNIIGYIKEEEEYTIVEINDILTHKEKEFYPQMSYRNLHIVERDISFITDLSYEIIENNLNQINNIIVTLKDIYENKNSLLINIKYLIPSNNQLEKNIENITKKIYKILKNLDVKLR